MAVIGTALELKLLQSVIDDSGINIIKQLDFSTLATTKVGMFFSISI